MYKSLFTAFALGSALLVAGCAKAVEPNYSVTLPASSIDPSMEGQQAFLIDFDNSDKIDSTVVANGDIVFRGNIDKPCLARVIIGGKRGPILVLEPGDIMFDSTGSAKGTVLNDRYHDFNTKVGALVSEFRSLPDDSIGHARGVEIEQTYNVLSDSMLMANKTNPIGLIMLMDKSEGWSTPADYDSAMTQFPELAASTRMQNIRKFLVTREETTPGHMFKDFEITNDGKTQKLSDYVGKGKYTLVDFWASWCGPCIRETRTLKQLYGKYADKGLDFLGVAVWDEPENTKAAIEQHELPWPQIINAQTVPTDLYGIPGIPCIILFDPEGRIVSRDKQGQDLIDAVDAAMQSAEK